MMGGGGFFFVKESLRFQSSHGVGPIPFERSHGHRRPRRHFPRHRHYCRLRPPRHPPRNDRGVLDLTLLFASCCMFLFEWEGERRIAGSVKVISKLGVFFCTKGTSHRVKAPPTLDFETHLTLTPGSIDNKPMARMRSE